VQVKYEMLRRVQAEGKSVTDASAGFGFSRPSFYQALSAFERDGLAGLVSSARTLSSALFILATMWKRSRMCRPRNSFRG
jgi:hypothetical protein